MSARTHTYTPLPPGGPDKGYAARVKGTTGSRLRKIFQFLSSRGKLSITMIDEKRVVELVQNVRTQCYGYLGMLCIVVNLDDPPGRRIQVGEQTFDVPDESFHSTIKLIEEILTAIIVESAEEDSEKLLVPRSPVFLDKTKT